MQATDVACTLFFSFSFLSPFYLLPISFLSPSCINFVLILGKVLVDYRIKCSLTLLKSPFIDVERRFSVFERRFNVFERTFNVYERRFYLSINVSFLSWKNCFSRVNSLFYLSFCSNSSAYSEWCKKKKSFENKLVFKAFSLFMPLSSSS